MHQPLLIPDGMQRPRRNFAQERCDVWPTECAEPILRRREPVGIVIIDGRAQSRQNQESMEVSLEQHVHVQPLAYVRPLRM